MLIVMLAACQPKLGEMIGTVVDGPFSTTPVSQGTLTVLDREFEQLDEVEVASDGSFSAQSPILERLYARVEAPGALPAMFSGTHPGAEPFEVPLGELYTWTTAHDDELHASFGACARAGVSVSGDVRLFGAETETGEDLIIANAFATLVDADGNEREACYLDDEGVFAPDAEVTGATGRFAFFDVEPGFHLLRYGYALTDTIPVEFEVPVLVPEQGVAPLYPAWVDLVL